MFMFYSIAVLVVFKLGKMILELSQDTYGNYIKLGRKSKYLFFLIDNFLFSLSISYLMLSFLLLTGKSMHNRLSSIKMMMFAIKFIVSLKFFYYWPKNYIGKES